ncbi:MAG: cyclohexa-1,5-diene-1-carbonyl-CoA hydratase [Acidobacteria bacterium]|jgi:cyclohexa-1,5-dienecarbonyl-CoA hydratase|nr:cyclohexa-1,5-diene-1-carbonyl-CoA hydratase [Acidobacteriota bacterium]
MGRIADTYDDKKSPMHVRDFKKYVTLANIMGNEELVKLSKAGELSKITLCRPPLNYLNLSLLQKLYEILDSFGEDPKCRALLLEAEGNAFSAGLELSEQTRQDSFLLLEKFHRVAQALNSFPRPTIALVRGMALGAGNELLACCDFVFASKNAVFGQPEIKTGSMASLAPLILPPLIGCRRMMEMVLTGNLINAKEAEQMGLIHRLLSENELPAAVEELLKTFKSFSSPVLALTLNVARQSRIREMETHLRESEAVFLNQLMELEDPAEGVKAFLEKRQPKWKNR